MSRRCKVQPSNKTGAWRLNNYRIKTWQFVQAVETQAKATIGHLYLKSAYSTRTLCQNKRVLRHLTYMQSSACNEYLLAMKGSMLRRCIGFLHKTMMKRYFRFGNIARTRWNLCWKHSSLLCYVLCTFGPCSRLICPLTRDVKLLVAP